MGGKLKVVSPIGKAITKKRSIAPRLETLEGKTVCEIWNGGFGGDIVFPIIEEMLRKKYSNIKIIPYTKFPLTTINSMAQERQEGTLEAVRNALLQMGCNALITGNAA
jgi:hypothetical protein